MKKRIISIITVIAIIGNINMNIVLADARPSAKDIPQGSIIIGSHIIQLSALNNENLDVALKSAETYSQKSIYYKSEFSKGLWYDITNASNIGDITNNQSNVVSEATINNLTLTHWTKGDGVTIELSSGKKVSIHNLNILTDPNNMPELDELKQEKDIQKSTYENTNDDDEEYNARNKYNSINKLFILINTGDVSELTNKLDKMQIAINYLKNDLKESEDTINIAVNYKQNLQLERDKKCYEVVIERILKETAYCDKKGYTDLNDKYWKAYEAINKKITEIDTSLNNDPQDVFDEYRLKYEKQAVDNAKNSKLGDFYEVIKKAYALNSIENNVVDNKDIELAVLNELFNVNYGYITNFTKSGDSQEYKTAKNSKESAQLLSKLKKEHLDNLKKLLDTQEKILDYILERMDSNNDKVKEIDDLIAKYINARDAIQQCDSKEDMVKEINDRISSLQKRKASLTAANSKDYLEQKDKLETLESQVDKLNDEYLEAIEEGELDKADDIKESLDKFSQELEDESNKILGDYSDNSNKKNQIVEAINALSEGKTPGNPYSNMTEDELLKELEETEVKIATAKMLMGDKTLQLLNMLEDIKESMINAIENGNIQDAKGYLTELVDICNLLPEEVFSESDKNDLISELLEATEEEYIEALENGYIVTAEDLESLENEISRKLSGIAIGDIMKDLIDRIKEKEESLGDDYINILKEVAAGSNNIAEKQRLTIYLYIIEAVSYDIKEEKDNNSLSKETYEQYVDAINKLEKDTLNKILELEYNRKFIVTDVDIKNSKPLIVKNNVTMVPARTIYEAFGANVRWYQSSKQALVQDIINGLNLIFAIDSNKVIANGKEEAMESKALLINGSTYIPFDYIIEKYDMNVFYSDDKEVIIAYGNRVKRLIQLL